ncbi:hypothetical protein [Eupransor demetentiae]|uniref:Phage protein n=1 Tax=Eupransor demetentiae TaxID=3109584 RepID=A0ABP0ER82_9LACO|nr:hypothetical protein R54876_GBNLAHCA_01321 [Lactobacillaceae bacterium LMG 33000]
MTEKKKQGRPAIYESATTAQNEANKRWAQKNKERKKYLSYRTYSRSLIKKQATLEDFNELEELIINRKAEMEVSE